MNTKGDKKELEILCRYIPRFVLSHYAHTRTALVEPVSTQFTAVLALFDISGFSTLADRLAKEENVRPTATPSPPLATSSSLKSTSIDTSRHASHRRISNASTGRQEVQGSESEHSINRHSISLIKEKRPNVGSGSNPNDFGLMRTGMAVEQLTKTLNQTLAPVIDIITQFNGDIIKFAGDAMIVMWEADSWKDEAKQINHGTLLFTAISCALEVLNMLDAHTRIAGADGPRLKMHVGMGFSTVTGNHVGGLLNRWEFYVGGPATRQMSIAESDAGAGELVISRECFNALTSSSIMSHVQVDFEELSSGNFKLCSISSEQDLTYSLPTLRLAPDLIPFVKPYVPGSISLSLGKGKLVNNGMRSITAIFIRFPGILEITDISEQVQEVHRCLCAVQDAAYRVHATIRQFLIDDKGAVAIVIVGLPPFYHENNALHAIRMALYLQEQGIRASIGITSGPAFCGSIGSSLRAEYAVVGDVINLSARLMSLAELDQILCDEATHLATITRFEFDNGSLVMLKGKDNEIMTYRVFQDITEPGNTNQPSPTDIFIPSDVYEFIITRVQAFGQRTSKHSTASEQTQTILLRGSSGAGKTKLLRHLANLHPNVYFSYGDSIEKNTKFFIWRRVISCMVFNTHSGKKDLPMVYSRDTVVVPGRRSSNHQSVNPSAFLVASTTRRSFKAGALQARQFPIETPTTPRQSYSKGHTHISQESISESPTHSQRESTEDDSALDAASNDDLHAHFNEGLQFVHALVASGEIPSESLPLLNVFIPHSFPESSHSLEISRHEERFMDAVAHLVLAIVRKVNESNPILLAWDDSQWIDAPSWNLLLRVLTLSTSITCVIGVRPDAPPPHLEFKRLESNPHTLRWELRNLTLRDTSLFLSQMYGIAIMNSYVLEYVHGRASGNPGNTKSLMERLIELETIDIDIERGVVHVLKDIHEVDLEISLQTRAKVMFHFDQMSTTSQLAMRIVSVAIDCIHFDALHYLLRSVYAIENNSSFTRSTSSDGDQDLATTPSDQKIASILSQALLGLHPCQDNGIIEIDSLSETVRYATDNMRLVVYNLMLPSQRETIHRVFALWYENEVPIHRIPRFQHCFQLGFHLSRTRMYNQSMHYFAKGAEEALLRGVAEYALTCLTSAGGVLLLMDTASSRGLKKSMSSRAIADLETIDNDENTLEMTLHQCKIEFLTGLVMVQKLECTTAVDNFNAAIAIYHALQEKSIKAHRWTRRKRRLQIWWSTQPWRRRRNKTSPSFNKKRDFGIHIDPSVDKLIEEVDAFVGVAKSLRTKILKLEREREKMSIAIRLQGLQCISNAKEDADTNLEKTFVLVPGEHSTIPPKYRRHLKKNSTNTKTGPSRVETKLAPPTTGGTKLPVKTYRKEPSKIPLPS